MSFADKGRAKVAWAAGRNQPGVEAARAGKTITGVKGLVIVVMFVRVVFFTFP